MTEIDGAEQRLRRHFDGTAQGAYLDAVLKTLPPEKRSLLAAVIETYELTAADPPAWLIMATMADLLGAVQAATINLEENVGRYASPVAKSLEELRAVLENVGLRSKAVSNSAEAVRIAALEAVRSTDQALQRYQATVIVEKKSVQAELDAAIEQTRVWTLKFAIAVLAIVVIACTATGIIAYRSGSSSGYYDGATVGFFRDAEITALRRAQNEARRRGRRDIADFLSSQLQGLR